jgi:O-antigen/teichoic acid export membrane protein
VKKPRGKSNVALPLVTLKHLNLSKSSAKFANAGLSFLTFIFLLRSLGTEAFAQLLVMYGLAGTLLWLTDMGLTRLYIYEFSRKNLEKAKSIWGTRLIVSILTITIFTLVTLRISDKATFFFALIALLDLFTDSFIETRIVNSNAKTAFSIQLSKRLGILLLMFLFMLTSNGSLLFYTMISYAAICVPIILYEIARNGTSRIKNLEFQDFKLSFGYWIQNAGTSLSNLDIPIISYLFGAEITVVISGVRKITTAIAMFGMTTSTLVFSESSLDFDFTEIRIRVRSVLVLTFTLSIMGIAFLNPILNYVLKIDTTSRNLQLSIFLLLLTTVGVFLSNMNSVLLGLKKIPQVTTATFLSSGAYLFSLIAFSSLNLDYYAIMIAILINYTIEFVFYRIYLTKLSKGVEF